MPGPWERYAAPAQAGADAPPWERYAAPVSGAQMASDDMTGMERFTAGTGYGAIATAQGLGQIGERLLGGTDAPEGAGMIEQVNAAVQNGMAPGAALRSIYRTITNPEQRGNVRGAMQNQINEDSRMFQEGIGQTGAGMAGNITGAVLASAPLGALSIPARGANATRAMIGPLTQNAARLAALQPYGAAAATGGIQSMLGNPVTGDGSDFAAQKAMQGATGAVVGGGVNALLRGAGAVAERLLPSNATATVINALSGGARRSQFAQEGENLARRTGVDLTPAAITGGKAQTMAENMARGSMFSRDLAFEADEKIANQVNDYIGKVASRISGTAEDAATVGSRIAGTVKNEVNRLSQRRSEIGGRLYDEVDDLAKGAPLFRPEGLRAELQKIIQENKGVIAADAKKATAWATQQLAALDKGTGLRKLIQNRRFWSAASAGKGNLFENASPGMQQRLSARVLGAIDNDLETAGNSLGGDIGDKLRRANGVWRKYSQAIEGVEASPLGKIMGDEFSAAAFSPNGAFSSVAPEKWVAKIKTLEPSQLSMVRDFLGKKSPEVWQQLKRRVIDDALEGAQQAAPSEGARAVAIRGNTFVNLLARTAKDQQKLRAIYSPRELAEIEDAFNVIRRWGDKTGTNFSGTAGAAEALGFMNTMKDIALKGSASAAGQVLGVRSVARLMNDQGGRAALLQLRRLPPQSAQARQIVSYLSAVAAGKEVNEMNDQQGGYDPNADGSTGANAYGQRPR